MFKKFKRWWARSRYSLADIISPVKRTDVKAEWDGDRLVSFHKTTHTTPQGVASSPLLTKSVNEHWADMWASNAQTMRGSIPSGLPEHKGKVFFYVMMAHAMKHGENDLDACTRIAEACDKVIEYDGRCVVEPEYGSDAAVAELADAQP